MKVMSCFNLIWVDKNNPVFMYLSVLFDDKTGKALISLIFQLAFLIPTFHNFQYCFPF